MSWKKDRRENKATRTLVRTTVLYRAYNARLSNRDVGVGKEIGSVQSGFDIISTSSLNVGRCSGLQCTNKSNFKKLIKINAIKLRPAAHWS